MLAPITTTKFKRDLKRGQKQKRDVKELREVMEKLIKQEPLSAKYQDHKLLAALGSHAELFKK